jgi:peptidyl-prolyl cis-trans isomerase SurA
MTGRGLLHSVVAAAALLLGGSAARPLRAWQAPAAQLPDTVDRIVAVVGNTVILRSQLDEELFSRFPQGRNLPTDPAQLAGLRAQILQELVDLELLYQRATGDTTVKVTEEQVRTAVDEQLRNVRQQYPSDQAYRDDLRTTGFQTPEEYRRWLTDRQRRQLTTNTLLEQLRAKGTIKPVIPTEAEMRAFYEAQRGTQTRPGTITFRQVVIAPKPTAEARQRARAQADSILAELRRGADFATAARRFSQDPGSREQGGSLGWFRRGTMHPAFEQVAFGMRPGFISDPVETPFGFHLIQVERVQPAEVSARHILISPEIRPEDADSARALAERIRAALVAGASLDSIQRLHHDAIEEREVRDFPVDRMLPTYTTALNGVPDRSYAPVFSLPAPGEPLRSKWAVVYVEGRRDAGEYRYEDVRDTIRGRLGDQIALRRYLDSLRNATYVEIRGP